MNRLLIFLIALALAVIGYGLLRPRPEAAQATPADVAEATGLETKPIHQLRLRDTSGASEYLVRNLIAGPIEVLCTLEVAHNARTNPPLPRRLVLPARSERLVATLEVIDPNIPQASGQIACRAMIGDPNAHPAENTQYALPFAAGTKFTLEQGFGGRFSHNDAQNHFALDFGVPEGTPVLAARAGVVMEVEEDFRAHGTDPRYGDRANYVRVLHDDGSMALYAHLSPESMLRKPGDHVVVGQLVGKSGNTGLSTGPHLHFAIQRNAGMALVSIPFSVVGVHPAAAHD
jgi:murein DD-endopeptidase MepM/ murein hydrolase activator NlpD